MSKYVLDAAAVIAYLRQEPGWQVVEEVLRSGGCAISTVNYAEVASKLAEKSLPEEAIATALAALNLELIDFDAPHAMTTGLLRPLTKAAGLSLGDRACLALAKQLNATALTTDQVWRTLDIGIGIRVIR